MELVIADFTSYLTVRETTVQGQPSARYMDQQEVTVSTAGSTHTTHNTHNMHMTHAHAKHNTTAAATATTTTS